MTVPETEVISGFSSHTLPAFGICGLLLAVAIVVMPPASIGITKKFTTNADITIGLNFTQALCVFYPCRALSPTLGDLAARRLFALGKHLGCFIACNCILFEHIIRDIINANFIALSGR
jgi:hypothetical protein